MQNDSQITPQETLRFLSSFNHWLSSPEGKRAIRDQDDNLSHLELGKVLMRKFRDLRK